MKKKIERNAIKGYLFGKIYKDILETIKGSFENTWEDVVETADNFSDIFDDHGIFFGIGLYAYYGLIIAARFLFGFLFTAIISLFILIGAGIGMSGVYIAFIIIAFIDNMYRLIKRISSSCPSCERKFSLPVYHCPHCGREHHYLFPNSYGILHHRCVCGSTIPTTFFNGRSKLPSTCPYCGESLVSGLHRATIFPVFGGRSSGKTCFINSALTEIENIANQHNYEFNYFYDVKGDERERFKNYMEKGILPESTHDDTLVFYNFYFNKKNQKVKNYISLCDVSGEVFQKRENIIKQVGYKYSDAAIFIIDPLSIEDFRNELTNQGYDVASYSFSSHKISDIIGAMITSLNDIFKTEKWKLNLVVVFTKADLPKFKEKFTDSEIRTMMNVEKCSYQNARNKIAEKFFVEYGEANSLNLLNSHFSNIRYYTASSLGDDPVEGQAFRSYGASEPILNVIKDAYKNIDIE